MNIILEGVDGTGKTYLSKILSEFFNMGIVWAGGPPKDYSEILCRLHEQQEATNTIFDRVTSVSEACYRNSLTTDVAWMLKRCRNEHIKKGDIFIYCNKIVGEDSGGFQDDEHQRDVKLRGQKIRLNYDMIFFETLHIDYSAKITEPNNLIDGIKGLM